MEPKEFVKGLYPKKKREGAPDFVLGGGSIKIDAMIAFCQEKLSQGEEWINYDVLQPKDETKKPYAVVNTWKPEGGGRAMPDTAPHVSAPQTDNSTINVDEIPF